MGLVPLLREDSLSNEQILLRRQFCEATGYGPSEILSLSFSTKIFLTKNGGKYQVRGDGSIQYLAGPPADPDERI